MQVMVGHASTLIRIGLVGLLVLLSLAVWQGKGNAWNPGPTLRTQAAAWEKQLDHARGVDVNTADVTQLERLPGLGPTRAARIIAYRSTQGPFRSPEELIQVRGVGPKTLERLRPYLRVNQ